MRTSGYNEDRKEREGRGSHSTRKRRVGRALPEGRWPGRGRRMEEVEKEVRT